MRLGKSLVVASLAFLALAPSVAMAQQQLVIHRAEVDEIAGRSRSPACSSVPARRK